MLHDDKKLEEIFEQHENSDNPFDGKCMYNDAAKVGMMEYAEHQAAPLEAKILALEEALAVAHEAAIKADRKERGRIGNVSGNELYAMFSNAPVEPHPLLADREVVL